jgi:hypothetical protein
MAQAIRRPHVTLNTDGHAHPRENALAAVTFVLGAGAFICGAVASLHLIGAILGVAGGGLAAYSQMISQTTGERWLNVTGAIMAVVGFALAVSHGGLAF